MTLERLTPPDHFVGNLKGIKGIDQNQSQKINTIREIILGHELNFLTLETIIHQHLGNHDVFSESHCYRTSQNVYESFIQIDNIFTEQINPEDIKVGALLHDVGKYCIDKDILNKSEALSKEEVEAIKSHPYFSYKMLRGIPSINKNILDVALFHHEKWDGSGYPYGFNGERIPKIARMFSVVDVWDALISERSYRRQKSIPHKIALKMMMGEEFSGFFDPKILNAFVKSKSYLLSSSTKNSDQSPLGNDLILQSLA